MVVGPRQLRRQQQGGHDSAIWRATRQGDSQRGRIRGDYGHTRAVFAPDPKGAEGHRAIMD